MQNFIRIDRNQKVREEINEQRKKDLEKKFIINDIRDSF